MKINTTCCLESWHSVKEYLDVKISVKSVLKVDSTILMRFPVCLVGLVNLKFITRSIAFSPGPIWIKHQSMLTIFYKKANLKLFSHRKVLFGKRQFNFHTTANFTNTAFCFPNCNKWLTLVGVRDYLFQIVSSDDTIDWVISLRFSKTTWHAETCILITIVVYECVALVINFSKLLKSNIINGL